MAVLRFDVPDLCECGRCGPQKYLCPVIEKRTRCGTIIRKCHVAPVIAPLPQVYLDYNNMSEVWYGPPGTIEFTKINPLTYQIGIPNSLKGKLRIKLDVIQECPRRRKKEETYTINLKLDDEYD